MPLRSHELFIQALLASIQHHCHVLLTFTSTCFLSSYTAAQDQDALQKILNGDAPDSDVPPPRPPKKVRPCNMLNVHLLLLFLLLLLLQYQRQ